MWIFIGTEYEMDSERIGVFLFVVAGAGSSAGWYLGLGSWSKRCRIAWKNHRKACQSCLYAPFLWLYVPANRNCHHSSSCWCHSVWGNPSASCSKSWRPTRWTGSTSCPVCPRWWCARLRLSSSSGVGGHCQPGVCPCCWAGEQGNYPWGLPGLPAWKRAAAHLLFHSDFPCLWWCECQASCLPLLKLCVQPRVVV